MSDTNLAVAEHRKRVASNNDVDIRLCPEQDKRALRTMPKYAPSLVGQSLTRPLSPSFINLGRV